MGCEFASDNTSGICPEAFQALEEANRGYAPGYGDDEYTARAADLFRDLFETDCDVYFVFNGTAANSLALASLCRSYHSVIAHATSHVETDECGGPEFFSNGTKLLLAEGREGRLDPASVESLITKRSDIHYPRPRVLSLTQSTELATVYSIEATAELCGLAKRHSMKVHMDGARFANAVASLGLPPKALSWEAGVDVLVFGGTKGGGFSEAVVFFDRELSYEFDYRCKQAGQLASKMRFLSAPWTALLGDGCLFDYARRANRMAGGLAERLRAVPGVKILYPVQANAVFTELPEPVHDELKKRGWHYYRFIGGGARFMCSWKTRPEDVEALAADIAAAAGAAVR